MFELVFLVVLGIALLSRPLADHAKAEAAARQAVPLPAELRKPKKATPTKPKLAREATSVLVLNGNGLTGAAGAQAAVVQSRGYLVAGTGNAARSDYARSMIMYRPGYKPEAQRLAKDLGIKLVGPLDGVKKKDLLGGHVALLVGN